jgi:hypothetical protein
MDEAVEAAIDVLADGTRLSILRALATQQGRTPSSPAVGFADLQRRVEAPDSGNFAYHLDRLVDQYVVKTEDGYRLTDAGTSVASAIVAGGFTTDGDGRSIETGADCPVCGEPIAAEGVPGGVRFVCGAGHGLREVGIPPAVLDRGPEAALRHATRQALQDLESVSDGACARCLSPVEWSTREVPPEHRSAAGTAQLVAGCEACGMVYYSPPELWALADWDVRARLRMAGRDVLDVPAWRLPELATETESLGGDPERFRVRFGDDTGDGTPFDVVIDAEARVLSVEDAG